MPPQKPRSLFSNWQTLTYHHHPLRPLRPSLSLPKPAPPPTHNRTLIAAPGPNTGPLMTRRSDRALPPVPQPWRVWARTLPVFLLIMTVSALGIFNYQKSSSSVVAAALYALRTSESGRRELGDEIYFRDKVPWIWGEMNQLHGRVDIQFAVKGTRGSGMMRFRTVRRGRMGKVGFFLLSFLVFELLWLMLFSPFSLLSFFWVGRERLFFFCFCFFGCGWDWGLTLRTGA